MQVPNRFAPPQSPLFFKDGHPATKENKRKCYLQHTLESLLEEKNLLENNSSTYSSSEGFPHFLRF